MHYSFQIRLSKLSSTSYGEQHRDAIVTNVLYIRGKCRAPEREQYKACVINVDKPINVLTCQKRNVIIIIYNGFNVVAMHAAFFVLFVYTQIHTSFYLLAHDGNTAF